MKLSLSKLCYAYYYDGRRIDLLFSIFVMAISYYIAVFYNSNDSPTTNLYKFQRCHRIERTMYVRVINKYYNRG